MKERILLHLMDYTKQAESFEVAPTITQEGIADAAGIDVPHFIQYARPLIEEGLVQERTAHVKGARRRRKVYDLTDAGKLSAFRLRDKLKSETIRVRDQNGAREAKVSQLLEEVGSRASILDVYRQIAATGTVDPSALGRVTPTTFVEMTADAPQLRTFVGRLGELDAVVGSGGPRLVVVRGVAGIGKSSFASKACDLLRGTRNLYWHRVRPWDTGPSILAGLGDFLAALGKPGLRSVLARGETQRGAQVLQEDLADLRALLVFDDAHEAGEETIAVLRVLKEVVEKAPDVRALILTRQALSFYDRRDVVLTGVVREIDLQGLGPDDVTALVCSEPGRSKFVELGLRLGGHPLFLELVRAQHAAPAKAMRDVNRFIKEEIYDKLTGEERAVMKAAALYGVPVPPHALVSGVNLPYDVVFSLADRSLIRPVGEDRFETHDTIRDFFNALLTPPERQAIGGFAARELNRLASEARDDGNIVLCVNYLSNAIQLTADAGERVTLLESLGDANVRIGDIPRGFDAFREVLSTNPERIVSARVHRKMASAFIDRGEIESASREVADARHALGEALDVERGWLDFVECGIAVQSNDWSAARQHGEAAIDVFRTFNEPLGLGETLLRFEVIETHSPEANPRLAEDYLGKAAELSKSITDPEFVARLHMTLFHFYAYHRLGGVERAASHLAILSDATQGQSDPVLAPYLLRAQAWFDLDFRADFSLATARFSESMAAAERIYDASGVATARGGLSMISFYRGATEEARRGFERCLADTRRLGYFRGSTLNAGRLVDVWLMWMIAECCLMQRDWDGFNRTVRSLDDPEYRRRWDSYPVLVKVLRAVNALLSVGPEASLKVLREAVGPAEEGFEAQESAFVNIPHLVHLFLAVVLRVIGREQESADHSSRAREILQTCHLQAALSFLPEEERRLAEALTEVAGPGSDA